MAAMTTDTSEKGLEALIVASLVGEAGYTQGDPNDYDREYAVDLVQLRAFLRATQPRAAETLDLDDNSPTRQKFLARLQGEISKRGVIDMLRHGVSAACRENVGASAESLSPVFDRPLGAESSLFLSLTDPIQLALRVALDREQPLVNHVHATACQPSLAGLEVISTRDSAYR